MRKIKIRNCKPAFLVTVDIVITKGVFCTALTDYFYVKNQSFPQALSKTEGKNILVNQLQFFGRQGEHQPGFFEASDGLGDIYNAIYEKAESWVSKNYPYLIVKQLSSE